MTATLRRRCVAKPRQGRPASLNQTAFDAIYAQAQKTRGGRSAYTLAVCM